MYKIRFGTDGWRAIIAQDFTVDNVKRVAMHSTVGQNEAGKHADLKPTIVLGLIADLADVFTSGYAGHGTRRSSRHVSQRHCHHTYGFLGTHDFKYLLVSVTASHNPNVQRIN